MWLHMTAGYGPEECHQAVQGLLPILIKEAADADVGCDLLHSQSTRHGLASALLSLHGDAAAAFAQTWAGTIEWVCRSTVRPHHGRKRWFVTVTAMQPDAHATVTVLPADLVYETMRATGPGGQHVNTTDSAVRLTHRPTGCVVTAQEERSQHRNRALALAKLHQLLAVHAAQTAAAGERARWDTHAQVERGNPVRSYDGMAFHRRG